MSMVCRTQRVVSGTGSQQLSGPRHRWCPPGTKGFRGTRMVQVGLAWANAMTSQQRQSSSRTSSGMAWARDSLVIAFALLEPRNSEGLDSHEDRKV
eukprot:1157694-Pelagomonas_calceolata.AAC.14